MSSNYKPGDSAVPHFVTFTVVGWIDVFSREEYKTIFTESLKYCQEKKGLILFAWVIMTNHMHLILSSENGRISDLVRDIKKFTSKRIREAITNSEIESRKEWMINTFRYAGRGNKNNDEFQFWKHNYHPVELSTIEMCRQRLDYLHYNPVKSGLV